MDLSALEDLRAAGAPESVIQANRHELQRRSDQQTDDADSGAQCWPENWHAWQLFAALATQWEIAITPSGKSAWVRLRYEVLETVSTRILHRVPQHLQVHSSGHLFDQLQLMETEALRFLNA